MSQLYSYVFTRKSVESFFLCECEWFTLRLIFILYILKSQIGKVLMLFTTYWCLSDFALFQGPQFHKMSMHDACHMYGIATVECEFLFTILCINLAD